jgi:pyrroloquinoline-quinone synthase
VRAVPEFVSSIMELAPDAETKMRIAPSMKEERAHVELWEKFAKGIGVPRSELATHEPAEKTKNAISELKRLTSSTTFEEGMAAMYAYESELPKISRSKIDGLKSFYGIDDHPTLEYFLTHEIVDSEHAALWKSMLMKRVNDEEMEKSVAASADSSLAAQNALLDSVLELASGP